MANITLKGAQEVINAILKVAATSPNKIAAALFREAHVEMTESKKRVPVDTTALKSTGIVEKPQFNGNNISVRLGYGGVAKVVTRKGDTFVGYAYIVHEDLEALHKVGQAKYLSSVIDESRPYMLARIAKRLDLMAAK